MSISFSDKSMAPMANQTEKMEVDEPKLEPKDKEKKEETPKDLNAVTLESKFYVGFLG